MRVTIEIRDDLLVDATREFGDDGSNDAEHDLLVELVDAISEAEPAIAKTYDVEVTESFRVRAHSAEEAIEKVTEDDKGPDVEWHDTNRRVV